MSSWLPTVGAGADVDGSSVDADGLRSTWASRAVAGALLARCGGTILDGSTLTHTQHPCVCRRRGGHLRARAAVRHALVWRAHAVRGGGHGRRVRRGRRVHALLRRRRRRPHVLIWGSVAVLCERCAAQMLRCARRTHVEVVEPLGPHTSWIFALRHPRTPPPCTLAGIIAARVPRPRSVAHEVAFMCPCVCSAAIGRAQLHRYQLARQIRPDWGSQTTSTRLEQQQPDKGSCGKWRCDAGVWRGSVSPAHTRGVCQMLPHARGIPDDVTTRRLRPGPTPGVTPARRLVRRGVSASLSQH